MKYKTWRGYNKTRMTYLPDHHRANTKGCVYEHILVMEEELGRPVVRPEVIHHIDEDQSNNAPENLMLFSDDFKHSQYHVKLRAFNACGNDSFRKCLICKEYDDTNNMISDRHFYVHAECRKQKTKGVIRTREQRSGEYFRRKARKELFYNLPILPIGPPNEECKRLLDELLSTM